MGRKERPLVQQDCVGFIVEWPSAFHSERTKTKSVSASVF